MKVMPFSNVEGVPFGAHSADVIASSGHPIRENRTARRNWRELEYPTAYFRFDEKDELVEASIDAPVISIGESDVPFEALGAWLRQNDESVFTRNGFLVSPAFGIAFDGDYPCWVTAFPKQLLALWRPKEEHGAQPAVPADGPRPAGSGRR